MILEIISFMGKLSFLGDKYNSIDFGSEWWMFSYIQLVLLCDSEGPENKNYILGSLLISIDKFFSDSIVVNDFQEALLKSGTRACGKSLGLPLSISMAFLVQMVWSSALFPSMRDMGDFGSLMKQSPLNGYLNLLMLKKYLGAFYSQNVATLV